MRSLIIHCMKLALKIIYAPMKLVEKREKKIVYLSRQSNKKSVDMKLLEKEINERYPEYQQVFRLKMLDHGLKAAIEYVFWLIGDMREIAGASIIICDTYSIPVSCLKHKKGIRIVQIWHAMGAVKQFGWQSVGKSAGRSEKVSRILQMHANYDMVIAPSHATAQFYSEAFHTPMEKMKYGSLPHIDLVMDGKSKKGHFLKNNPMAKDKKIVLYVPTFREGEEVIVENLRKVFEQDREYELIISLHPLSKAKTIGESKIKGKYSTFDLMKIADCIITDYSACAFEASLLEKPLYFYTPDYDMYKESRGLNVDLRMELEKYNFDDPEKLLDAIQNQKYDYDDLLSFQHKYVLYKHNCTERMAKLICEV